MGPNKRVDGMFRKTPILKIERVFFAVGLFALSVAVATAQTAPKRPALPSNPSRYVDEYPVKLMKVPAVKTRLKTLLGKRYADFDISIAVQSPMTKVVNSCSRAAACLMLAR